MRILLISEYFFPLIQGGGELSAYYLAKHLAEKGVEVHVLTSWFKGLKQEEVLDGIHFHRLLKTGKNPRSFLSSIGRLSYAKSLERGLAQLAGQHSFDLIHCMNMTSLHAVALKKQIKVPFIAHVNSPLFLWPSGVLTAENMEMEPTLRNFVKDQLRSKQIGRLHYPAFVRYNPVAWWMIQRRFETLNKDLKRFDAWIGISPFMTGQLLKQRYPKKSVYLLPNIVPLQNFLSLPLVQHTPPRILYVGQYEQYKGPHILLEALAQLKPPYQCSFYGAGSLQLSLQQFVTQHRLPVHINPELPYSKIPAVLAAHDIVVFPSLVAEAFGRVVIEGMAASKPVVGSKIGGIQHLIKEKKTGLLFTPGSAEELAEKLTLLVKDSTLRRKMGNEGRKIAQEGYMPERIVHDAMKIYAKVLDDYHRKRN